MGLLDDKVDGENVEWKKLGEVCEIKMGRVISKKYLEENKGIYPVYSSQTRNNGEIGKIDTYDFDGEYATWTTDGAYAGTVFYRNGKFSITNICGIITPKNNKNLLVKFIVYWLQIESIKHVKGGSGNPKLMSNVIQNIPIPIPSIKIQENIVDILDKFTLLIQELQQELQLRIKQYEYYRDMLLSEEYLTKKARELCFDNFVVREVRLGEIADYGKEKISASYLNEDNYVSVDNLVQNKGGKIKSNYFPIDGKFNKFYKGDILIGNIRPYLKKIWLSDVEGGCNNDVLVIQIKKELVCKLLSKYLFYILSSDNFFYYNDLYSNGAKMPRGNKEKILDFKIFLPPLLLQEKIVEILDKFQALVEDARGALPAEIEARQKEYEYYREKLLTFSGLCAPNINRTLTEHYIVLIKQAADKVGVDISELFNEKLEYRKLEKLSRIYDGIHQTPKYKNSGVPFISVENIKNIYSTNKFITKEAFENYKNKAQKNDLFMTRIGNIGTCAIVEDNRDLAYYVTLALIKPNVELVNTKYLKFFIESSKGKKELNKWILHNATPIKINLSDIGKIDIPLPPLSVQNHVASTLDKFDTLVNDIKVGIPAEIELIQKKYEYYREKLLSFNK